MGIKNINVAVTDEEMETLEERKGSRTWREYILEI